MNGSEILPGNNMYAAAKAAEADRIAAQFRERYRRAHLGANVAGPVILPGLNHRGQRIMGPMNPHAAPFTGTGGRRRSIRSRSSRRSRSQRRTSRKN